MVQPGTRGRPVARGYTSRNSYACISMRALHHTAVLTHLFQVLCMHLFSVCSSFVEDTFIVLVVLRCYLEPTAESCTVRK